jgi:hypothetical protein
MENLEHLHQLSRRLEDAAAEVRAEIGKILDTPIRRGKRCVYDELIAAGYSPGGDGDYGHGTAWSACTRIIDQRQALLRLVGELQAEAEVLTGIADDLIGKTGRLV